MSDKKINHQLIQQANDALNQPAKVPTGFDKVMSFFKQEEPVALLPPPEFLQDLHTQPAQRGGPNPMIAMELSMALLDNVPMEPKVADAITTGVLSRVYKEMPQVTMGVLQKTIADTFPLAIQVIEEQLKVNDLVYGDTFDTNEMSMRATMSWHAIIKKNLLENGVVNVMGSVGPSLMDSEIDAKYKQYFRDNPSNG